MPNDDELATLAHEHAIPTHAVSFQSVPQVSTHQPIEETSPQHARHWVMHWAMTNKHICQTHAASPSLVWLQPAEPRRHTTGSSADHRCCNDKLVSLDHEHAMSLYAVNTGCPSNQHTQAHRGNVTQHARHWVMFKVTTCKPQWSNEDELAQNQI